MPPNLAHREYRPDIDGLRAVAVLSVVAFHAFPNRVRGGFIGVDIFFVISGFLISSIIFEGLNKGTFSFLDFYSRRIKRIFPALILVLGASYVFGWFVLFSDELKQLGKHVAAGASFISNFALWREAGYFDHSGDTKPLLHLWSLGIEEQFYIFWPVFIFCIWKRKTLAMWITGALGLTSFVLNLKNIGHDPSAAFYFPQTRFWELLIGSMLAWCIFNKKTIHKKIFYNLLSALGLSLLVFGFWRINKDLSFPGKWALIPTLGTAMIIFSGPQAWINRRFLSNPILVWFGLISFPLYLWHWPILSFVRIMEIGEPTRWIRGIAALISVVLAWITYRFIERPIRFEKNGKVIAPGLSLLMIMFAVFGYSTYLREGVLFGMDERDKFISHFENSFPDWKYFKKIKIDTQFRLECGFFNSKKYFKEGKVEGGIRDSKPVPQLAHSCYLRDPKFSKAVLIWGDSHAQALSPGIVEHIPKNWQVLQIASSGCAPDPDIQFPSEKSQCDQSNYLAMKTIRETNPDVVVVAQVGGHETSKMIDLSDKVQKLGVKKILFLGPTPQWNADLPRIFARRLWWKKNKRTEVGLNNEIIKNNKNLLKETRDLTNAEYIDVIGFFCNSEGCLVHTDDNFSESMTTWDCGHLTPSASKYLAKHLLVERIISAETTSRSLTGVN